MESTKTNTQPKIDESHYNDGLIDARNIQEFCMVVFTNSNGETKTVSYDDNFFSPIELVNAYTSLWRKDWNMDDEKASYVQKFKEWQIACGCNPEELEDDE